MAQEAEGWRWGRFTKASDSEADPRPAETKASHTQTGR